MQKPKPPILSEEIRMLIGMLPKKVAGFQYDLTDTLVNLYGHLPTGDTAAFAAVRRAKFFQPTGLKVLLRRIDPKATTVKLRPSRTRVTKQGVWLTVQDAAEAATVLTQHLTDLQARAKTGKVVDNRSFKPGRRNRAMPAPKA